MDYFRVVEEEGGSKCFFFVNFIIKASIGAESIVMVWYTPIWREGMQ